MSDNTEFPDVESSITAYRQWVEQAKAGSLFDRAKLLIERLRSLGGVPELCNLAWELGCENESLRAELAQLRAASAWQDIVTAPKDGRYILIYTPHRLYPVVGYWLTTSAASPCWWEVNNFAIQDPQGWMPLPSAPPTEEK
jgi:hypothetical protein